MSCFGGSWDWVISFNPILVFPLVTVHLILLYGIMNKRLASWRISFLSVCGMSLFIQCWVVSEVRIDIFVKKYPISSNFFYCLVHCFVGRDYILGRISGCTTFSVYTFVYYQKLCCGVLAPFGSPPLFYFGFPHMLSNMESMDWLSYLQLGSLSFNRGERIFFAGP